MVSSRQCFDTVGFDGSKSMRLVKISHYIVKVFVLENQAYTGVIRVHIYNTIAIQYNTKQYNAKKLTH